MCMLQLHSNFLSGMNKVFLSIYLSIYAFGGGLLYAGSNLVEESWQEFTVLGTNKSSNAIVNVQLD